MQQLGMFAKYWQPGRVKTRLAHSVGDWAASQIYHQFICVLTQRMSDVGQRRVLAFTPDDREREFSELADSKWTLVPQSSGDLGERMKQYFNSSISAAAGQVVLIGTDSPTLPIELVEQAFEMLERFPVVLGPSTDGGYYLIGISCQVPPIFEGVTWSSELVWKQTVELLDRTGTPFAQLPPWYDVDDVSDLQRLDDELSKLVGQDPVWSELARTVQCALEGTL